jgi:hypothetical protein
MGATTSSPVELSIDLPATTSSPQLARSLAGWLAGRVSDDRLDDLRLLLSDTVSAAVRNASGPRSCVHLRVGLAASLVFAEVRGDPSPTFRAWPHDVEERALTFALLDGLTSRWGCSFGGQLAVWFEIALERAAWKGEVWPAALRGKDSGPRRQEGHGC